MIRSRWHIVWHHQLLASPRTVLQHGLAVMSAVPARNTLARAPPVSASQPHYNLIIVETDGRQRTLPPIFNTGLKHGRLHLPHQRLTNVIV